jgi:hypothetical protein
MRVVGIALMVSVLCGACAFQPADGDEAGLGSSAAPAATTGGVHVVGVGTQVQAGTGAQTTAPTPCTTPGPNCDPQPNPWGGRPPVYAPTTKQQP